MKLRDFMAGSVGLKTGNYIKTEHVTFEPEKEMGLFKTFKQNDHEAIIGADDKHLNFIYPYILNRKAKQRKYYSLQLLSSIINGVKFTWLL